MRCPGCPFGVIMFVSLNQASITEPVENPTATTSPFVEKWFVGMPPLAAAFCARDCARADRPASNVTGDKP